MSDLTRALFITVAGMGLVFVAILLFWVAMSLLMRVAGGRARAEAAAEAGPAAAEEVPRLELQRRAALAAVAVALALEAEDQPRPFPLPPPVLVNTWQSVMRARALSRRGGLR